jgi:two-component sensor histidine kinase
VTAPGATGFGTRLIQRVSVGDLGGGAELDFRPEGLAAVVRFKL